MKQFLPFLLVIFSFSTVIYAQEITTDIVPKRVYTTKRLQKVPVIDGDISEAAWNVVEWSSDFTEKNQTKAHHLLTRQSLK